MDTSKEMLATLRPDEQENDNFHQGCLYPFKYDEQDNFFVQKENGEWVEEVSTAFTFTTED